MKKTRQNRFYQFVFLIVSPVSLSILGCSAKTSVKTENGFSNTSSAKLYNDVFYSDDHSIGRHESSIKDFSLLNKSINDDPSRHEKLEISESNITSLEEKQRERIKKTIEEKIDLVSRILNYSDGIIEDGSGHETWIAIGHCEYQKVNTISGEQVRSINLNQIDPRYLKVATFNREFGYNNIMSRFQTNDVLYDGKSIFRSQNTDIDRIRSAWTEIYQKYCKGQKKDF